MRANADANLPGLDLGAILGALARALAPLVADELAARLPSPAAALEPLIEKREIARALAVSIATVDRLDREGQPHVYIGDAKRYDLAEVLRWHRERSAQPEAPVSSSRPALPPAEQSGVRVLSRRRAGGAQ